MNPRSAAQPSSYSFGVTQTGSYSGFSGGVHVGVRVAVGDVNGDSAFAAPQPNQVLIGLCIP